MSSPLCTFHPKVPERLSLCASARYCHRLCKSACKAFRFSCAFSSADAPSASRSCERLRDSERSLRSRLQLLSRTTNKLQLRITRKIRRGTMGNEAPNWKNLTSPSVAVFLQDYIKSGLNTLIQPAYRRWRRPGMWHEPAFSQFVACDMPIQYPVGYPTAASVHNVCR